MSSYSYRFSHVPNSGIFGMIRCVSSEKPCAQVRRKEVLRKMFSRATEEYTEDLMLPGNELFLRGILYASIPVHRPMQFLIHSPWNEYRAVASHPRTHPDCSAFCLISKPAAFHS